MDIGRCVLEGDRRAEGEEVVVVGNSRFFLDVRRRMSDVGVLRLMREMRVGG